MRKTSKLTVRVTVQDREALERLAAIAASSVSWQVQRAIAAWLSNHQKEDDDEDRRS